MVLRDVMNQRSTSTASTGSAGHVWNVPLLKRVQMALANKTSGSENQEDVPITSAEQSDLEVTNSVEHSSQVSGMEPTVMSVMAPEDLGKPLDEASMGDHVSNQDPVICEPHPDSAAGDNNNQIKAQLTVRGDHPDTSTSVFETANSAGSLILSDLGSLVINVEPLESAELPPQERSSPPVTAVPPEGMTSSQVLSQPPSDLSSAPVEDIQPEDLEQGPVIITKRRASRAKKWRRCSGMQPLEMICEGPPQMPPSSLTPSLTPPDSSCQGVAVPKHIPLPIPHHTPAEVTLPTPPEEEAPTKSTMLDSRTETAPAGDLEPETTVAHVDVSRRRRGPRSKQSSHKSADVQDSSAYNPEVFTLLKPHPEPTISDAAAPAAQITARPVPKKRTKKQPTVVTPPLVSMETISEDSNSSSDSRGGLENGSESSALPSCKSGVALTILHGKPKRRGRIPSKPSEDSPDQPDSLVSWINTETDKKDLPKPIATGRGKSRSDGSIVMSIKTSAQETSTTPTVPQCESQPVTAEAFPAMTAEAAVDTVPLKPAKRGRKPRRRSGALVAPLPHPDVLIEESSTPTASLYESQHVIAEAFPAMTAEAADDAAPVKPAKRGRKPRRRSGALVAPLPHPDVLIEESSSSLSSSCSSSSEPAYADDDVASTLDLELALRDQRVAEFFNEDLDAPHVHVHTQQTKAKRSRRRSSGADICPSNILKSPEADGDCIPDMPMRRSRRLRRQSIEFYRASLREREEEAIMMESPEPAAVQTGDTGSTLPMPGSAGPRLLRQANVTEPEPPAQDASPCGNPASSVTKAAMEKSDDMNDSLSATPDNCHDNSVSRTTRGRKRKRETSVEEIYLNKLWRTQMPKEKTWETIYEQPRVSRGGDESYQSAKRFRRTVNFDDFYLYNRLKRRRQKAAKQGWKPMTQKREAIVEKLLEERMATLEEELTRSPGLEEGRYDRAMCAFLQLGDSGDLEDTAADVSGCEGADRLGKPEETSGNPVSSAPSVPHTQSLNSDSSASYPLPTPDRSHIEDTDTEDIFYTPARTVSDLAKFNHLDIDGMDSSGADSTVSTPNNSNNSTLSRTLTLTPEVDLALSPSY